MFGLAYITKILTKEKLCKDSLGYRHLCYVCRILIVLQIGTLEKRRVKGDLVSSFNYYMYACRNLV